MDDMRFARIDVSRHDKANVYIGKFTNGRLNPELAEEQCKFSCVEEKDRRNATKRTLVCETDDMRYEGVCTGPGANKVHGVKQMLAAYNKQTGKVYLYDTHIAVMKPVFKEDNAKDDDDKDETDLTTRERTDNLTSAFGSVKKRRAMESRLRNKIGTDALETAMTSAVDEVLTRPDAEKLTTTKPPTNAEQAATELPPHNKDATVASEAYTLEGIIPPEFMSALEGPAQEFLDSDQKVLYEWVATKTFPSFITNHLSLMSLTGPSRLHKSKCLTYLYYMIFLYKLTPAKLRDHRPFPREVPNIVQKALFDKFTVHANTPGKKDPMRCMPARLKDKLLAYIMVLCLILEDFNLDFTPLLVDLKIGQDRMIKGLRSLGCRTKVQKLDLPGGQFTTIGTATLPIPLTFPEVSLKQKKGRR